MYRTGQPRAAALLGLVLIGVNRCNKLYLSDKRCRSGISRVFGKDNSGLQVVQLPLIKGFPVDSREITY